MKYVRVEFADGTLAIREVETLTGHVLRYCDELGNDLGRLYEAPQTVWEEVFPLWAVQDPPVIPEVPVVARWLSKIDYMSRFTDAELVAIYSAARSVVEIEVWLAKFNAVTGEGINLDDERTAQGVYALEAVGLIGPGRAAEILG